MEAWAKRKDEKNYFLFRLSGISHTIGYTKQGVNMIKVTLEDTIPWVIVVIFKGEKYGRDNCLIHEKEHPLVAFYDRRYLFDTDPDGNVVGQLVARYYYGTLVKRDGTYGLDLQGNVPDWKITKEGMEQVYKFLTTDYTLLPFLKKLKEGELDKFI